jgi:hypothetical protein
VTQRQHRALLAWLLDQRNVPDRGDVYRLQNTAEIRRILYALAGIKKTITLKELVDELTPRESPKLTPEQKLAAAKAGWAARMGMTKPGR